MGKTKSNPFRPQEPGVTGFDTWSLDVVRMQQHLIRPYLGHSPTLRGSTRQRVTLRKARPIAGPAIRADVLVPWS